MPASWEPTAKTFLDTVMQDLPFFIRSQAKSATVEEAENQAAAEQAKAVTKHHVVMAMIEITPAHMKGQLKAMLTKRGVEMAKYASYFT